MRTRTKICGITRIQDIDAVVAAGVDAIGFVFYAPSPRSVTPEQAKKLLKHVPAYVQTVGLFVNATGNEIEQVLKTVPLDLLQFHGDETPEQCQQLASAVNKRWIKALRINTEQHTTAGVSAQIDEFAVAGANSILLDAYHPHKYGGTGARFDWSLLPQDSSLPIILAGGLDADNVAATLELPIYAVDVSGGIESGKGKKDAAKMRAFMKAVKRDRWQNETLSEPSNNSN